MTNKEFYFTNSRFKFIALLIFLMWVFIMLFFIWKAEEITHDPCSICAERMGEDITCYAPGYTSIKKTYYYNGSTELIKPSFFNK